VAILLGISIVRSQLRELDEHDQDQAVVRYHNLGRRFRFDKNQQMKEELDALANEIKSRWNMTPEELTRHFSSRYGIRKRRSLSTGPGQLHLTP
jgi:hypothetical protein